MRPGSFEVLPDGRLAVGTRRGDVYFISGAFESPPAPDYHLFASGQDEIFGLSWKDGSLTITQFGEVTRLTDTDGDGAADHFDAMTFWRILVAIPAMLAGIWFGSRYFRATPSDSFKTRVMWLLLAFCIAGVGQLFVYGPL